MAKEVVAVYKRERGGEKPFIKQPPVRKQHTLTLAGLQEMEKRFDERLLPLKGHSLVGPKETEFIMQVIRYEIGKLWQAFRELKAHPGFKEAKNRRLCTQIEEQVLHLCECLFEKYHKRLDKMLKECIFDKDVNLQRVLGLIRVEIHKRLQPEMVKEICIGEIESGVKRKVIDLPNIDGIEYKMGQLANELNQNYGIEKAVLYKLSNTFQKNMHDIEVRDEEERRMRKSSVRYGEEDLFCFPTHLTRTFTSHPELIRAESLLEPHERDLAEKGIFNFDTGVPNSMEEEEGGRREVRSVAQKRLQRKGTEMLRRNSNADILNVWNVNDVQSLLNQKLATRKVDKDIKDIEHSLGIDPIINALAPFDSEKAREKRRIMNLHMKLVEEGEIKEDKNKTVQRYLKRDSSTHIFDFSLLYKLTNQLQYEPKQLQSTGYDTSTVLQEDLPSRVSLRTFDTKLSSVHCSNRIELCPHPPLAPSELRADISPKTLMELDSNLMETQRVRELYNEVLITEGEGVTFEENLSDLIPCAPALGSRANNAYVYIRKGKIANAEFMERNKNQRKKVKPKKGKKGAQAKDSLEEKKMLDDERNAKAFGIPAGSGGSLDKADYLRFLSMSQTDFLCTLFNLIEEDEIPSIMHSSIGGNDRTSQMADEKASLKPVASKYDAETREQRRLENEIFRIRKEFKKGFWNPSVLDFGGLGVDPDFSLYMLDNDGNVVIRPPSPSQKEEPAVIPETEKPDIPSLDMPKSERLQMRLEFVWSCLRMPEYQRINMVVKYGLEENRHKLADALDAWDKVCRCILHRERLLKAIVSFERCASDPRRYFSRGSYAENNNFGSSSGRLDECRERQRLLGILKSLTSACTSSITSLERRFEDCVTYRGRDYIEKMKCDYTEILYWLQEERLEEYRASSGTEERPITTPFAYIHHLQGLQDVDESEEGYDGGSSKGGNTSGLDQTAINVHGVINSPTPQPVSSLIPERGNEVIMSAKKRGDSAQETIDEEQ
eukprot:Nk52_evm7s153 gene=Nk52_evmTU7s153